MAVRRTVIHAGHQKTGTTSIQRTLYAGRDRLRRLSVCEGIVYRRGSSFAEEAIRSLAAALHRRARERRAAPAAEGQQEATPARVLLTGRPRRR